MKINKFTFNSNIDNRNYYDTYQFLISNKEDSDFEIENLKTISEYPAIKKVVITLSASELVSAKKNIRVSTKKKPETLSILKNILKIIWGKTSRSTSTRAYNKNMKPDQDNREKFPYNRLITTSIILHDKEDIYELADTFYFHFNVFNRYPLEDIQISELNPKTKEQIVTISIALSEFPEIKDFEEVTRLDFNLEKVTATFSFVLKTKLEITN